MGLFHKQEAYLGIDIGAHGIKLVELKKNKKRPQLWTYGVLSKELDIHPRDLQQTQTPTIPTYGAQPMDQLAPDLQEQLVDSSVTKNGELHDERIKEYGELLKSVVAQSQATSKRATASLPVSHVFHAVITLPMVPQKELDHHVKAKVSKMLPLPIDDMQVVHQVVPSGEQEKGQQFIRVLVTAAPKTLVQFFSQIFSYAGLILEELETEAFALERSLVGHDPATMMIIDIGGERSNFFIVDQGLPITHRSIQIGGREFDAALQDYFGVDIGMVQQMKMDVSRKTGVKFPHEPFLPLLDPIIKEISYSINLFTHQTGNEHKRVEKIILTGGGSLFAPLVPLLEQAFSLNVFIGDPWARVVYQQGMYRVLDEIAPRMAVSIGLAMRNIV